MNGLNNWNPHSLFWGLELREANRYSFYRADLAQLAEQRIRNAQVRGSIPPVGTT